MPKRLHCSVDFLVPLYIIVTTGCKRVKWLITSLIGTILCNIVSAFASNSLHLCSLSINTPPPPQRGGMCCHTTRLPVPPSQTQYSLITELPSAASLQTAGFPELMHCKFQLNKESRGWDQRQGCGARLTEECQAPWRGSGTNEPKPVIARDRGAPDVRAMGQRVQENRSIKKTVLGSGGYNSPCHGAQIELHE